MVLDFELGFWRVMLVKYWGRRRRGIGGCLWRMGVILVIFILFRRRDLFIWIIWLLFCLCFWWWRCCMGVFMFVQWGIGGLNLCMIGFILIPSGGFWWLFFWRIIWLILLSISLCNSKVRWWVLSISGISSTCSLLCWFCCALSFIRFACTLWCTHSRVESQPRCCSTTRSIWDAALCGRSSPESLATSSGASSTGSSSSTTKCKSSVWPGPTYFTWFSPLL